MCAGHSVAVVSAGTAALRVCQRLPRVPQRGRPARRGRHRQYRRLPARVQERVQRGKRLQCVLYDMSCSRPLPRCVGSDCA